MTEDGQQRTENRQKVGSWEGEKVGGFGSAMSEKWKVENGIEEAENRRWEVEKMRKWEDWKREVGLLQRH
jgi:hypothetical protein